MGDLLTEALDTMDAAELLEEFIKIAKDKGYMLAAGAKEPERRAMLLLQNHLISGREKQPGGELGAVINRARVALVEAAQASEFRDDGRRSAIFVDLMAAVQKQIPGEWLDEFDRQRLERLRAEAAAT